MERDSSNSFRIFCIGRNYADHAAEMGDKVPAKPVIFLKPSTCLVSVGTDIHFPSHGEVLHHEVEIVVRIGKDGRPEETGDAISFVDAVTIGLDLTLRDLQAKLKDKGLPWETSKAFDQSAPVGVFLPYDGSYDLNDIAFTCRVNGETRQWGNSKDMIFGIERLIFELGRIWRLRAGDLLYTGTPAGIGPMHVGDLVEIESPLFGSFSWRIVA